MCIQLLIVSHGHYAAPQAQTLGLAPAVAALEHWYAMRSASEQSAKSQGLNVGAASQYACLL
jgi:hypothetical protein